MTVAMRTARREENSKTEFVALEGPCEEDPGAGFDETGLVEGLGVEVGVGARGAGAGEGEFGDGEIVGTVFGVGTGVVGAGEAVGAGAGAEEGVAALGTGTIL